MGNKQTIVLKNGLRIKVTEKSDQNVKAMFDSQLTRQPWRVKTIREGSM